LYPNPSRAVVRFCNKRGTAKQWVNAGKADGEPIDAAVSEKPMEYATTAGVQDSRKAEESRSDHLGDSKCTESAPKGSVGDKRAYTLMRWNAKKRIPVFMFSCGGLMEREIKTPSSCARLRRAWIVTGQTDLILCS
jgi:hypothetical protein